MPNEQILEAIKQGKDLPVAESNVPSLSESKLKDLTWALDINQNVKGR